MQVAELQSVTKRYGTRAALDSFDLDIQSGELLALLGPNGAGKTTAVRLLLGLTSPTSGVAKVFGADPRSARGRDRTGAMLQVGRVPDTLRVRELVELFSSYYPSPLPPADVVKRAGLDSIFHQLYGTLSTGQRQRVLFALAICGNPSLLILDEPTVGLDVDSRRTMWRHIRGFVAGGGSVLLTTHYLEEADALADRIVVMAGGKLVANGTPAEIKQRGSARRIRCVTSIDARILRGMPGVRSLRQDGVYTEMMATQSDTVVRGLFELDPSLADLEVTGAGLEEAFLALTEQAAPAKAQEVGA